MLNRAQKLTPLFEIDEKYGIGGRGGCDKLCTFFIAHGNLDIFDLYYWQTYKHIARDYNLVKYTHPNEALINIYLQEKRDYYSLETLWTLGPEFDENSQAEEDPLEQLMLTNLPAGSNTFLFIKR